MRNEAQIRKLLVKYLNDSCSQEEIHQVRQILKDDQYDHIWKQIIMKDAVDTMLNEDIPKFHSKKQVFQKIDSHLSQIDVYFRSGNSFFSVFGKTAAVFIALILAGLAVWQFLSTPENKETVWLTKQTQAGQKSRIELADGSIVHLNSNSSLSYPETFTGEERIVKLSGEGFFEITEDKKFPFVVKSQKLRVKVLGTSFNVQNDSTSQKSIITVSSGKVLVSMIENSNKILDLAQIKPDQQLSFDHRNQNFELKKVNAAIDTGWKDGKLIFENTPMSEVAARLQRWYGIDIYFENQDINACRFTGKFQNVPLEYILNALTMISSLNYEIDEEQNVTINGEGCE